MNVVNIIKTQKRFCIYIITNIINNKVYIGKTNDIKRRLSEHLNAADNKQSKRHLFLHRAISKYGKNNFKIELLEQTNSENKAYKLETKYILKFKSNNKEIGYNLTDGGRGAGSNPQNYKPPMLGKKHSQKTKDKLSKIRAGSNNPFFGKRHTKKHNKKISLLLTGSNNHNYGKRLSEAQKLAISKANKGNKFFLGKKHSEETKKKISAARRGRFAGKDNPFFGKKHSEETKKKMSIARIGKKYSRLPIILE